MRRRTLLRKLFQRITYLKRGFLRRRIKAPHALWVYRNTLTEGHVFVAQGFSVDGIWQFGPKQPNHRTNRVVSKSGKYLIEW